MRVEARVVRRHAVLDVAVPGPSVFIFVSIFYKSITNYVSVLTKRKHFVLVIIWIDVVYFYILIFLIILQFFDIFFLYHLDLNLFLVGLPRRGDLGSRFRPRRPLRGLCVALRLAGAGAGSSSTRITTGGAVIASVVGFSVVVVSTSIISSILPSLTSISWASRNCLANLKIF